MFRGTYTALVTPFRNGGIDEKALEDLIEFQIASGVDGLVPVDIVKKMLSERPQIAGITLAGMPAGAPGMGGSKTGPFTVYAFTKDGKAPSVYAIE